MNAPESLPAKTSSQLHTILLLFLILRLSVLFMFTPQGLLNAYTDATYYFRSAQLSEQGYYPLVNMWYEYPPILAYLPQSVYALTRMALPAGDLSSVTYQVFSRLLGLALLPFEAGTLILLFRLSNRSWGIERANWTGWVYASLSLPMFYWSTSHHTVVTFFFLLTLDQFLQRKIAGSALAMGLGIASKLTPIYLFAPVVKFLWPRRVQIIRYGVIAVITVGVFYAPFILLGGEKWIMGSLTALGKASSWSTVWAMMDGNWGTGFYGLLDTRIDLTKAGILYGNPAVIPGWLTLILFGILYAWFYFRPIIHDSKHFIWFAVWTAIIFHLWSKGWSPQWAGTLIPLFLLAFPGRNGLIIVLALTGIIWIEWPLAAAFDSHVLLGFSILARTGLFVGVGWMLGKRLLEKEVKMA